MKKLSIVMNVEAAAELVLAEVVHVEHWPAWTSTMLAVTLLDPRPLAVGKRASVRQPRLRPATWEVTEFDASGFTWVTRRPGLCIEAGHIVKARGRGSEVELTIDFSGWLAPLFRLLYRRLCLAFGGTSRHWQTSSLGPRVLKVSSNRRGHEGRVTAASNRERRADRNPA